MSLLRRPAIHYSMVEILFLVLIGLRPLEKMFFPEGFPSYLITLSLIIYLSFPILILYGITNKTGFFDFQRRYSERRSRMGWKYKIFPISVAILLLIFMPIWFFLDKDFVNVDKEHILAIMALGVCVLVADHLYFVLKFDFDDMRKETLDA